VATQKAKRKRRGRGGSGGKAAAARGVRSPRREERAERQAATARDRRTGERMLGKVGERPEGLFGGVPVSEFAILAGLVSAVVGFIQGGANPALIVGLIVLVLGVVEVTAREHFSGYRSHTTLLAGVPAIAVGLGVIQIVGSRTTRQLLLFIVLLVFAGLFYAFRRAFMVARQRRVARR
jgi:hypothetical protein